MLLVTDIGNTNINIGIYNQDKLIAVWKIASDIKKTSDEYGVLILAFLNSKGLKVDGAIISCVVAPLEDTIYEAIENYLHIKPIFVSYKSKLPVKIEIETPPEIGADRIANAACAAVLYKLPAIIVDIGTATTFDVIDDKSNFIGGIIAAGPKIQAMALSQFTSKLPKLKIKPPKNIIGKNTFDAMLSGIVTGHNLMVTGLVEQIKNELGKNTITVATGGFSEVLFNVEKNPFDYIDKNLTLFGLKILYELNK